jgi:hypothetical protein
VSASISDENYTKDMLDECSLEKLVDHLVPSRCAVWRHLLCAHIPKQLLKIHYHPACAGSAVFMVRTT